TFGTLGGTIDPATLQVTLDQLPRTGQLGETFDLDITDFTSENPCADCLRIEGVGVAANGHLLVDISLRHPFKDQSFFFTRPDLNVFDTRVIAILDGTDSTNTIRTYPDNSTAQEDTRGNFGAVVNQDGMTSHFDSRAEDPRYFDPPKNLRGNINAFKRYFEDPRRVDPFFPQDPEGWNVMPIASPKESQVFELDLDRLGGGGAPIPFVLVAEAAWGVARDRRLPDDAPGGRFNPRYWLPEFNQHEPWRVDVTVDTNTLIEDDTTSRVDFTVRVSDWQHGGVVDPNYPDVNNLMGLDVQSDVAQVQAVIPGVNEEGQTVATPESGTGTAEDPLVYRFSLQNQNAADPGSFYGLVAAVDTLNGSSAGPQRVPDLGFPRLGAEIINYVGYRVFPVTVRRVNRPPSVVVTRESPEDGIVDPGGEACFSADVVDDPGEGATIEWDFSFDATEGFQVEGTGEEVCATFNEPGIFTIAVRVTDDGDPPLTILDLEASQVRVNGVGAPFRPLDAGRRDRTANDGGQSAMAFTGGGALVMAFSGMGNGEDVFASRTVNGLVWSTPVNISNAGGTQTNPDMSIVGNAVLVVWEEDGSSIRGAISTDGGVSFGPPFLIAPNGLTPAVTGNLPTTFYVAYSNGGDVFIEANATGNLSDFSGNGTIVNDETDGLQTRPDL
ncbi:MAG TPA: PKD domain-containing protein, partial [bacterium]|nr:PKD domain-containing protein [bacterium]